MKKELSSYYVKRTNPFAWIAGFLLVLAAGLRIVFFWDKPGVAASVWFWQAALPAASAVLYAVLLLVCGPDALYKTALPVGLGAIGFFLQGLSLPPAFAWMCCLYCLLLVMVYTQTMQGRIHTQFLLLPLFALPVAYVATLLVRHWQGFPLWRRCAR